jgi:cytochrome c-type biogenesis protein
VFEVAGVGLATAFLAGVVSFLSPCVLPLVPGYVSYIAGHSVADLSEPGFSKARLAALRLGASFVLGFSLVFLALGASATALGQLLQSYRGEADAVAGAVVIVFGLHLMGAFRLGLLNREWRLTGARLPSGGLGSLLFGAAFGFGWTPCIGPILGSILMLGATRATVGDGVLLLSIYSLGLAVPFLLVAAFTANFMRRLGTLRRIGRHLQTAAGAFLVLVGVAMATGSLTSFGTWLLNAVPGLQYLVI